MQEPLSDHRIAEIRLLMRATFATALATLAFAIVAFEQPHAAARQPAQSSPRATKVPARTGACESSDAARCPAQWRGRVTWYRA